jgi:hypothetical protein
VRRYTAGQRGGNSPRWEIWKTDLTIEAEAFWPEDFLGCGKTAAYEIDTDLL